jgi:tight adherence protein B
MGGDMMFILAAAAAFFAIGGVGWVVVGAAGDSKANKRMACAVGGEARRGGGHKKSAAMDQTAQRRKQIQETLKDMEERHKEVRNRSLSLRARIQQAGLTWSPGMFWGISVACGLTLFLIAFITGNGLPVSGALGAVGVLGLPRWYLGFRCKGRQKKFSNEFANALDVIVRGVKSGLPLNECLKIIARESPDPVGGEFEHLCEGIAVGVSLEDGLSRMYERMPLAELNFFRTVLVIQQKTGGNLAEALSNLSTVLRSRKLMREKIAALSSEAKASALIIGSLPPGVMGIVYATTPSYMGAMFTHPTGQLMLLGGLTWMAIGILTMRSMINFKI